MNTLVSLNIDLGIHKGKMKVAQNEKQKKTTRVFFIHKHSKFWSIENNYFFPLRIFSVGICYKCICHAIIALAQHKIIQY